MSEQAENCGDILDVRLARSASSQIPPEVAGSPQDVELAKAVAEDAGTRNGGSTISYRRLVIIMSALSLTIFLNALDQVCLWTVN